MHDPSSSLDRLRDPQIASHVAAAQPAWLWSADAAQLLWANPVGAAIFGAASPAAIAGSTIDPKASAALQIARIAGSLPPGGSHRLERLRGFGGRFGGLLTCACSRMTLEDGTPAILVAATTPAGPDLSLAEQARRLLDRVEEAAALWDQDGMLLAATPQAQTLLGDAKSLSSVDAEQLGTDALARGESAGETASGALRLIRIGTGSNALLLTLPASAAVQPAVDEATPPEPTLPEPTLQEPVASATSSESESPAESVPPAESDEPPADSSTAETPASDTPTSASQLPEGRRQPLRFVWQIDGEDLFTLTSDEFIEAIGPDTASALGQSWDAVAKALELDPDGQAAAALASRDTFSGITLSFPADGSEERVPVEMSGLPVFDRNRDFRGYRGFGICRDRDRLDHLLERRKAAVQEMQNATAADAPQQEALSPEVDNEERPALSVVPPSPNVVPFRGAGPDRAPSLTPVEHKAFGELASRLTARLRGAETDLPEEPETTEPASFLPEEPEPIHAPTTSDQRDILDRLPVGVLVYRLDNLIYANKAFLDWTGYGRLDALANAGGLDALFVEAGVDAAGESGARTLAISTQRGDAIPVSARLFSTPWDGETALVLMLDHPPAGAVVPAGRENSTSTELRAILDVAAEGILVLGDDGRIASLNRRAQSLFEQQGGSELIGLPFAGLFTLETQRTALDLLSHAETAGTPPEGREIGIRRSDGGTLPLFMTMGRIGQDRLCAVFQDIASWKRAEAELTRAREQAEKESEAKSDFLARISHEIRTPLNAIIGFSEVMLEERFGPVGNERYAQYLKDVRSCGEHVIALLNDLVDLSRIESGKLELEFTNLDLNALTQECVTTLQPQASRERVIIRTALSPNTRAVTADARSLRQIIRNLLSHSIRLTGAGGQVIVSTAVSESGEAVLRVRDTGTGMTDSEIAVALEPFRQTGTSIHAGASGTGVGLPLTKALAEANRATFNISSAPNGTLVEVSFPGPQIAAE